MNAQSNKNHWFTLKSVILVVTSVAGVYLLSIMLEAPIALIAGLGLSAFVGIIWMAVRILKDPFSTDKTFEEYFYGTGTICAGMEKKIEQMILSIPTGLHQSAQPFRGAHPRTAPGSADLRVG